MKSIFSFVCASFLLTTSFAQPANDENSLHIKRCEDFTPAENGSDRSWNSASWINIPLRTNMAAHYDTKVKILYSATGLYFLYSCQDAELTNSMQADFLDLWNEDVIEVFLQPDERNPAYLEYELSPLNFELPIIIYNEKGKLNSWIPFHYEDNRRTSHQTQVLGGEKKPHARVKGWTAEFFIPYTLMRMLTAAPSSGSRWKTNLFRIDYDHGETLFSWQPTSGNFHEYKKFGYLIFD